MKKKVINLEEEAKKRGKAKKKKPRIRARVSKKAKLAIAGAFVVCAVLFGSQVYNLAGLAFEKSRLETIKNDKDAELSRLNIELERVNDPQRVEELARERFHMLKEGETLYVFPEEEIDTTQ
ncbi:MAG: septum formation initiator family protein [Clostridiales Family XIII bacterium]|nr:septum formation initiator family protein [Clostridiales Family XIII bacterium]